MRTGRVLTLLMLLVTIGCGGSSTSPSSNGSSGGSSGSSSGSSGNGGGSSATANGSVTFKVDGVQDTASGVTAAVSAGVLTIGATDASRLTTLGFAVSGSTPGTYNLSALSPTNALLQIGNPVQGWQAGVGLGSGSVTITAASATNVTGTFSFTMVPTPGTGSSGNRSVTDGAFNVTLK